MNESIISVIIQSASWPISMIILALMFRKQITKLSTFKIKDYEFSFDNELANIKKDANIKENVYANICTPMHLSPDMIDFAKKTPMSAVIHTWGLMENFILKTANENCNNIFYTPSSAIQALYDDSLVNFDSFHSFVRLYSVVETIRYKKDNIPVDISLDLSDLILEIREQIENEVLKKAKK